MMTWCLSSGGWLMTALIVAGLALAIWAVTHIFPTTADPGTVLDARLARGEIDVTTHRMLREAISGGASPREEVRS